MLGQLQCAGEYRPLIKHWSVCVRLFLIAANICVTGYSCFVQPLVQLSASQTREFAWGTWRRGFLSRSTQNPHLLFSAVSVQHLLLLGYLFRCLILSAQFEKKKKKIRLGKLQPIFKTRVVLIQGVIVVGRSLTVLKILSCTTPPSPTPCFLFFQ